jgi:hypothetical protein
LESPRDLGVNQWVDVLSYVDPPADAVAGQWWRDGDAIHNDPSSRCRLMLPIFVDGSYEIETDFTRDRGNDLAALILPIKNRQVLLGASGGGGGIGGFWWVDRKGAPDNATAVRPSRLDDGHRYTLHATIALTGDQVKIESSLDGEPFAKYEGPRDSLSVAGEWSVPESHRIALAANEIDVTFHRARVRLLSGRGQLLDRQRHRTNVPTPENGNPNAGYRFHDLAPSGSRLVGLRFTATNVLHSMQPIYAGKPQPPATVYGQPDGDVQELLAKPGYAVGAVVCKAWGCVEGLRVVFFRDGGNRLDPNDSYESASVGGRGGYQEMTLGGRGQPIVGLYGAADRELNSLGLIVACDDRRLPALPSNLVPLTRAQPLRATVGGVAFLTRRSADDIWTLGDFQPYVPERLEYCGELIYAHAPSRLVYGLPSEAKSFTAVGYCVGSGDVKFRVLTDGQVKYESPRVGVVSMAVDIPPGARTLELVVDDLGDRGGDWSHWLMPRLHSCRAADVGKNETGTPIRLTECQPLLVSVGAEIFRVNQARGPTLPPRFDEAGPCNEFLFAHAPSQLTYAIPPGATEFSAIGYNVRSTTVKFRVFVDGRGVFESPVAGIVPVHVALPPGAKRLDLIVDDFDGNGWDWSFWCYPRFSTSVGVPPTTITVSAGQWGPDKVRSRAENYPGDRAFCA